MALATFKFINSNASQDFLDFTVTNYDIFNLAILLIISIYLQVARFYFLSRDQSWYKEDAPRC
jgi:hypothetical protein